MEALLQNQKTEIDDLNRLINNYTVADASARKTERHLTDKFNTFSELYRVIKENNEEIQSSRTSEHDVQPYFVNNTFTKITELYEGAMSDIRARLKSLSDKQPQTNTQVQKPNEPAVQATSIPANGLANQGNALPVENNGSSLTDSTNTLNNNANNETDETQHQNGNINLTESTNESNLLKILYNELMDCLASARNLDGATSFGYIEATIKNMNFVWTEFRAAYLQQRTANTTMDFSYSAVLNKYMKISGDLNDIIKRNRVNIVKTTSETQFSLPKLKLHEFHGKISEWKSFIANFDRMIHNNNQIDDGMKIEYLKMSIKGDAAKLINHIDPNPENYHICYDILKKRYENKREILNSLISKIVAIPKIKMESAELLKSLHDSAYECIMSIRSIGVSTENWDPLLTYIISSKLDPATIIHYECQLVDVREPQNFTDLLLYIESRFMALQSAALKSDTFNDQTFGRQFNKSQIITQQRHMKNPTLSMI